MPGIKSDLKHPAAPGKRPKKRLTARATPRIGWRMDEVALLVKIAEIAFERLAGVNRNLVQTPQMK